MPAEALKKPDEAAMFRILARHPYSPEGVILRLAWQEGLSRKELNELTWDQVDLDGRQPPAPGPRRPPGALRGGLPPGALCPVSQAVQPGPHRGPGQKAHDAGKRLPSGEDRLGQRGQDVSLKDLRRDWIVRQIKANGWACAARVSGMAVGSLRGIFPAALWEDAPQPDVPQTGGDDTEYSLWRIVQQEGSSTAALPSGCAGSSKCSRGRSSP